MTTLFIGDSITDCGRDRDDPTSLGSGYVAMIAGDRPGTTVVNRGIGGNRVRDLRARWETDCTAWRPETVSIHIGINDTWRRYDADDPTTAEEFERDYVAILEQLKHLDGTRLVMMEPFLVPVRPDQAEWRADLDPKLAVVRRLAAAYGATLVPLDVAFTAAAETRPAAELAHDGVHPTPDGHRLIADAWQGAAVGSRQDPGVGR